ncbi:hypothetical protein BGZ61DRAFT_455736 [Ilyonectria robusta]|uniref:uncharacterized protein n=1 Tax=Ilyonectria robusta TaxID=1079257 RepID=UPI001E8E7E73|nr:uncharacterized protein BGZ61DRAFT_455736 [Ilyonectria robusta]KAH8684168.1 hypothetical protein BGZ61DRAFT_455736 [Ilyonectria robusta]
MPQRDGTAQQSSQRQWQGQWQLTHGTAADYLPPSRLFSPSLPYQLAVREREKGKKQTWNPSIHRIPPPIASPVLHPPSSPHLRSYPRERLGTGNKTEHDAQLEGRIEMGMGINHVWSTGSHASGAEQARPEEARAERDTVTEAGAALAITEAKPEAEAEADAQKPNVAVEADVEVEEEEKQKQ